MERNIYYEFLHFDDGILLKINVTMIFCCFTRQGFKLEVTDDNKTVESIYDYHLSKVSDEGEYEFFLTFRFSEQQFCDIKSIRLIQYDIKNEKMIYYSFPICIAKKGGKYYGENCKRSCKIC